MMSLSLLCIVTSTRTKLSRSKDLCLTELPVLGHMAWAMYLATGRHAIPFQLHTNCVLFAHQCKGGGDTAQYLAMMPSD